MVFGIFFGLLEAVVVIYLRQIFGFGQTILNNPIDSGNIYFSLGVIAFLKPAASNLLTQNQGILSLEVLRELSTIVMLLCLAVIAGRTLRERLAYFLLAFSFWDIFYYVFLRAIIGWPSSLLDIDVYFLIPVAWVGPVMTPIIISIAMAISAIILLERESNVSAD